MDAGQELTDAGLANLKDLPRLTTLGLNDTRVTDDGLGHLRAVKGLTRLDVRKTGMTAEGLKTFHAAVPRCLIEHDGGTINPTD